MSKPLREAELFTNTPIVIWVSEEDAGVRIAGVSGHLAAVGSAMQTIPVMAPRAGGIA